MTFAKHIEEENKDSLYDVKLLLANGPEGNAAARKSLPQKSFQAALTRKTSQILKLLWENGDRKIVYSFYAKQIDFARKLNVTRQALSVHFKRLRESGFVQVGRGFVNVTEDGLKAIGYNSNPVIVTVRISPQKRLDAFAKIKGLPTVETFRVTGDVDVVLVLEQEKLDEVLGALSGVDGVIETKSFVSIENLR